MNLPGLYTIVCLDTLLFTLPLMGLFFLQAAVHNGRKKGLCLSTILYFLGAAGAFGLLILRLTMAGVIAEDDLAGRLFCTIAWPVGVAGILFTMDLVAAGAAMGPLPRKDYAFIVILGCKLRGGDTVPPMLAFRLKEGIAAFHHCGDTPEIIVSGGQIRDERIPEAEAMAAWLVDRGIPPVSILKEDRSANTWENIANTKAMAGEVPPRGEAGGVLIVTSNFHVLRARIIAREMDFPADGHGSFTPYHAFPRAFIRDFLGVLLRLRWPVLILLFVPAAALWFF